MHTELYNKISKSCCVITVYLDDEKISEGSGFCFLPTGEIVTAAHVVTGRMPIRTGDADDPGIRIFAKFPNVALKEYKVNLCSINVRVSSFLEDIQIDVAILIPVIKEEKLAFLIINTNPPALGQEVFIAGYPDELKLPYQLEKIINKDHEGVTEFLDAMEKGYMADMTGPLIKRAVVGNIRRFIASNPKQEVKSDVFYLDNGMHSGASGGPVVTKDGDVVGIITQRAITSASQSNDPRLEIPSGSTICISLTSLLVLNQKAV